jgi:outer membrane protein
MRKISLVILVASLLPGAAFAQAPAAPAAGGPVAGRVAVVDFQKAVVDNTEGKKAQEKYIAEVNKRQKEFEEKQKAMADAQTKLQNGDKTLNDTAKTDLAKQIDKMNTELQRMNDDAQKDLPDLQQQLFRPIAERAQEAVRTYSAENGFSVVFDTSSQASSIIYNQDIADITTEIIRRIDAAVVKGGTTPAAAPPKAPEPAKKQ